MHTTNRLLPSLAFLGTVILGLLTGCVSTGVFLRSMAYEPARSPVQIEASAVIEGIATLSPGQKAFFQKQGLDDTTIANMLNARGQTIRHDLIASGIFARGTPPAGTAADYQVRCHWEDGQITLTATQPATGRTVSTNRMEFPANAGWDANALPTLMNALKAELVADLQGKPRPSQGPALRAEEARNKLAQLEKTPLAGLLADSDESVVFARARNRAIIAAKNQQLPGLLRDSKTTELSTLVVRIEQTILDLNHESEVAKDRAQQVMANNGNSGQIEELRGLTISYRERIELLKPILSALKEEIANRSR